MTTETLKLRGRELDKRVAEKLGYTVELMHTADPDEPEWVYQTAATDAGTLYAPVPAYHADLNKAIGIIGEGERFELREASYGDTTTAAVGNLPGGLTRVTKYVTITIGDILDRIERAATALLIAWLRYREDTQLTKKGARSNATRK